MNPPTTKRQGGNPTSPAHLRKKTARIAQTLEQFFGTPRPSPGQADPVDMLVATILSQNTNDRSGHREYTNLRAAFERWEDVMNAPVGIIANAIKSPGTGQQKSLRVKKLLTAIRTKYGRVNLESLSSKANEEIIEELTAFEGVGLKSAASVLLFSFRREIFPVDTHIHRICNRLSLVQKTRIPEITFEKMKGIVPVGRAYSLHINLIRFGRLVCRAEKPICSRCPLFDECLYEQKEKHKAYGPKLPYTTDFSFMLLDNSG